MENTEIICVLLFHIFFQLWDMAIHLFEEIWYSGAIASAIYWQLATVGIKGRSMEFLDFLIRMNLRIHFL